MKESTLIPFASCANFEGIFPAGSKRTQYRGIILDLALWKSISNNTLVKLESFKKVSKIL